MSSAACLVGREKPHTERQSRASSLLPPPSPCRPWGGHCSLAAAFLALWKAPWLTPAPDGSSQPRRAVNL